MRCYCFQPLSVSFSLYLYLLRSLCVLHVKQTRRKLNKASKFAGIALQLLNCFNCFHLFPAISSICVPSASFSPSLSPSPSPFQPLTHLHVSFRWKITPFKNLLYVLPDFSFILFHIPHATRVSLLSPRFVLQFGSLCKFAWPIFMCV